jgi:hypothetical protein
MRILFTIRSPFHGRCEHARCRVAPSPAADFNELEAERLDLSQDAVKGGLVGKAARQHRVAVIGDRGETWKRRQEAITEKPADPNLEPGGHDSFGNVLVHGDSVGAGRMSARRPDRMSFRRHGE